MGVDYSSVSGYGFALDSQEDDLRGMAERVGFVNEQDEDDPDYFDGYEFVDWLCSKFGLNYGVAGDSYSGELFYLIGVGIQGTSLYGLQEFKLRTILPTVDDSFKIQSALDAIGIPDRHVAFYSGMHVW